MSILGLIAAFGGGVFAAAIGAVPAFIMTGVFSIVGAVTGMCGAGDASNILVNYFAFGPFFRPHIAFAGGVAAAAYAKKKGVSENINFCSSWSDILRMSPHCYYCSQSRCSVLCYNR